MTHMSPSRRSVLRGLALMTLARPLGAQTVQTGAADLSVAQMADGLRDAWAIAFLPEGRMLVTEKAGELLLLDPRGRRVRVGGVPRVDDAGQGGLLDVVVRQGAGLPEVFLTYAEPVQGGGSRTAVARGTLDPATARLTDVAVIFRQRDPQDTSRHYGARVAISPDGTLFVTLGDRGQDVLAQSPDSHCGKVVRIHPDGRIPADNPRFGETAAPGLWSIGHRNPQAAAIRPADGRLWITEHGARGGDELNRPEAGRNYGWPVISYGRHYSGFRIGEGTAKPGMEQPVHYWDPSMAPSGLAFLAGSVFPLWEGQAFAGALKFEKIVRLRLDDDRVVEEEDLFTGRYGRIRDVRQGTDGALWFLTDATDGALYRVTPQGPA